MMCRSLSLLLLVVAPGPCTSRLSRRQVGSFRVVTEDAAATCAPLANKGSHFTVDIQVGTPGQTFAVVADTGSDSVIVPSCICQENGSCSESDRCFRGTNKSSTFFLKGHNSSKLKSKKSQRLPVVQMVFGSGAVQAIIASDVVQVGNLKAKMKDGVLLMVDHQLRMAGAFEGILGLGQPKNETEINRMQKEMEKEMIEKQKGLSKAIEAANPMGKHGKQVQVKSSGTINGSDAAPGAAEIEAMKKMIRGAIGAAQGREGGMEDAIRAGQASGGQGSGGSMQVFEAGQGYESSMDAINSIVRQYPMSTWLQPAVASQQLPMGPADSQENPMKEVYKTKSFLQSAKTNRFSMCFNDKGKDGALHLGSPKDKDALTSVGTVHWGLDLQGITVGNKSVPVKLCSQDDMKDGQKTACGAIPDSGTTLFMAPQEHIEVLLGAICDGWKRCSTATSTGLQKKKAELLALLLSQCGEWMTEENGLDELPTLHFQVAGANGKKRTLSLDGAGYVIEQMEEEMKVVQKTVMGMPFRMPAKTGKKTKVCAPAFGTMEMNTKVNGPVWIFGSPLFYEYTVGYDLDDSNPAVSFSQKPCGCSKETALVSKASNTGKRMGRQPRILRGLPRMPSFDFSMGL